MNKQDAIKSLKNIVEYWTYRPTEVEAAKLAISALEKQIPKKVDYTELNYSNLPVSKCPACKSKTVNSNLSVNYCPDCGQAIDWRREDE